MPNNLTHSGYSTIQSTVIFSGRLKNEPITLRILAQRTSFGNGSFERRQLIDIQVNHSAERHDVYSFEDTANEKQGRRGLVRSMSGVDLGV